MWWITFPYRDPTWSAHSPFPICIIGAARLPATWDAVCCWACPHHSFRPWCLWVTCDSQHHTTSTLFFFFLRNIWWGGSSPILVYDRILRSFFICLFIHHVPAPKEWLYAMKCVELQDAVFCTIYVVIRIFIYLCLQFYQSPLGIVRPIDHAGNTLSLTFANPVSFSPTFSQRQGLALSYNFLIKTVYKFILFFKSKITFIKHKRKDTTRHGYN